MSFLREFWEFLKVRKKYWLLAIIIVLVLLFILLVMSIVEDKKEMNLMYRILFAVLIIYLVKIAVQDLGGYIQREL